MCTAGLASADLVTTIDFSGAITSVSGFAYGAPIGPGDTISGYLNVSTGGAPSQYGLLAIVPYQATAARDDFRVDYFLGLRSPLASITGSGVSVDVNHDPGVMDSFTVSAPLPNGGGSLTIAGQNNTGTALESSSTSALVTLAQSGNLDAFQSKTIRVDLVGNSPLGVCRRQCTTSASLDSLSVATPEPGSAFLVLSSLALLYVVRRRRSNGRFPR